MPAKSSAQGGRPWMLALGLAVLLVALFAKIVFVRHALLSPGSIRTFGLVIDLSLASFVVGLVALTRRPLWWGLLADAIVSLTLFAAMLYVGYFDQLPTLALLGLSKQLGDVNASVTDLIQPSQLLLFADFLVIGALAIFAGKAPRRSWKVQSVVGLVVVGSALVIGFASADVAGITGPIDSIEAARFRGLVGWTVGSAFRPTEAAAVKIDPAKIKSVQEKIDELAGITNKRIPDAPKHGVARNKNVIVIQVEALQAMCIGKKVDGVEITPNLNKLAKSSWYFPNVISQAGRGLTADVEFVQTTSMFPPNGQPAAVLAADRVLPSLPRTLGDAGYRTETMHVNRAEFWNRIQLYPAIGFQKYYDVKYFGKDDMIYLGASDEVFFDKTMPLLQQDDRSDRPFYAQLVTITSHHPFPELPASKNPMALPAEYQGNVAGRYIQDINYTDRAIGQFMDDLDKAGILDDTIVVIYGDHFALKPTQPSAADKAGIQAFGGKQYSNLDAIRIPLFIHLPKQTKGVTNEQLIGQTDIAPTIADLLGTGLGARPVFGGSAFRVRKDNVVVTGCLSPTGSFVTPAGLFRVGMGMKGARLAKTEGGGRGALDRDKPFFERAEELRTLCDSYTAALPIRVGAGTVGRGAKLPPAAQRALEERKDKINK